MATLITTLIELGHEVVGFTSDQGLKSDQESVVLTGNRFRLWLCPSRPNGTLPHDGRIGRIWDFFKLERAHLEHAVRRDTPDVLHAHWTYEFAMVALASNVPCLITAHDDPLEVLRLHPTPYTVCRFLMARWVLRRARHVTTVSKYVAQRIARLTINPVQIVANPLPKWIGAIKRKKPTDPGYRRAFSIVMAPGYWNGFKNPMPGIKAFENIRKHFEEEKVELLLFGFDFGPGGRAQKKMESAGLSLNNVLFMGSVSHQELIGYLGSADVLVHTSLSESFGMAVAEAMAVGTPVIAGRSTGALPWLLEHGLSGQLTDVTSQTDIETALMRVIRKEPVIERMACRAKARISEVASADTIASQYLAIYSQILKSQSYEE